VVLIGLACKNAVLIVEYARTMRAAGHSIRESVVEASRLRLRPIVMTSVAFILGVIPLVFATGAGAEMRQALGVAVFAGMIGVTIFGLFLTPVFFCVIEWLAEGRLFRSRWVRRAGQGGLDLLRLQPVGRLLRVLAQKSRSRPAATRNIQPRSPHSEVPS
jgi:multidrug efflux pump